jgi:hypothetical protein
MRVLPVPFRVVQAWDECHTLISEVTFNLNTHVGMPPSPGPSLFPCENLTNPYASLGLVTAEVRLFQVVQLHDPKNHHSYRTPSVFCILAGIPESAYTSTVILSYSQHLRTHTHLVLHSDRQPDRMSPPGQWLPRMLAPYQTGAFRFSRPHSLCCSKFPIYIRNNASRLSRTNSFAVSKLRRMLLRSKGKDMQNN